MPVKTIIWQVAKDAINRCVERDWILEMLGDGDYKHVIDENGNGGGKFSVVVPGAVLVASDSNVSKTPKEYLARFNGDLTWVHISDEYYTSDISKYNMCKAVIRVGNAYGTRRHPYKLPVPSVQIPQGYVVGLRRGQLGRAASSRQFKWCFTGCVKNDTRRDLLRHLDHVVPKFVRQTGDYGHSCSLFKQTADTLADTVFVPNVPGNHVEEASREWDALEWGCIPIIFHHGCSGISDYHTVLCGTHPMPVVKSWSEAAQLIESYMQRPEQLDALQLRVHTWWTALKRKLQRAIAAAVDGSVTERPVYLIGKLNSSRSNTALALLQSMNFTNIVQTGGVYATDAEHKHRFPSSLRHHTAISEWGCALAHRDVWQAVLNGNQCAIICENDVRLVQPPSETRRLIDGLVDGSTDICFLGYHRNTHTSKFLTTHAYALTPAGAAKLLNGPFYSPVDHYIRQMCIGIDSHHRRVSKPCLSYSHAIDLPNTRSTKFGGIIKQSIEYGRFSEM